MAIRRLVLATAVMTGAAVVLRTLAGPWRELLGTLSDGVTTTVTADPERLVVAVAGLLAWVAWAWGAFGLVLTAAAELPGACGAPARVLSRLVLPAGLRSASGLALGLGLLVSAPAAAAAPADEPGGGSAADPAAVAVPDWPSPEPRSDPGPAPPEPPDRPATTTSPAPGDHVVVPGDCLWDIAEDRLRDNGPHPTDAQVARAVDGWWSANASVIGPDPDLIRPGQVLGPPPGTTTSDARPGSPR